MNGVYLINHAVHGPVYIVSPGTDEETRALMYHLAIFDGVPLIELTLDGHA